jgi:hypothetical protein
MFNLGGQNNCELEIWCQQLLIPGTEILQLGYLSLLVLCALIELYLFCLTLILTCA